MHFCPLQSGNAGISHSYQNTKELLLLLPFSVLPPGNRYQRNRIQVKAEAIPNDYKGQGSPIGTTITCSLQ